MCIRDRLDIGTGSGCIAISLDKRLPDADVEAWDISEEALAIARTNNEELESRVLFRQRDVLFDDWEKIPSFDVIVSNPPYVTEAEKDEMEANVLDWEPALALFVPDDDPLRFYRRIAALGRELLLPEGKLYFEINREMCIRDSTNADTGGTFQVERIEFLDIMPSITGFQET